MRMAVFWKQFIVASALDSNSGMPSKVLKSRLFDPERSRLLDGCHMSDPTECLIAACNAHWRFFAHTSPPPGWSRPARWLGSAWPLFLSTGSKSRHAANGP